MTVADEQENLHIRKTSGEVDISGKLVSFLYLLGRDGLPLGEIETIFRKNLRPDTGEFVEDSQYTNGWLALWAEDLAERLT